MLRHIALLVLVMISCLPTLALAHKPSDSYLTLTVTDERLEGRWDIALRDLEEAMGLDSDLDGTLTWGEVAAKHGEIAAYALARLELETARGACRLEAGEQLLEKHSDGAYTVIPFTALCTDLGDGFSLRYRLLFDMDPLHRGLAQIVHADASTSAILSPEHSRFHWTPDEGFGLADFFQFMEEGVWHIWIGVDHILFLLTLLFGAALRRESDHMSSSSVMIDTAKIVTAFTVAHSLTLAAAATELVVLPSPLVEAAIALSIMIGAANAIRPFLTRRLWLVAFGFGLVHGFGFANVLSALSLPGDAQVLALLGFNIGVEIGQLAIVAAVLPLLVLLGRDPASSRATLKFGSVAILALGCLWLVERSLGFTLLMG